MAPAVVKEEAGRYLGAVGADRIPSRGEYGVCEAGVLLGLFQAERGWNRMCVHVCVGWVGWGVGAWGQLRTQRWVRGVGGETLSSCKSWEISTKYQQ